MAVAWLAFVFQFLLLLVCAAAAGRIGIGRRSPQLLAFGFFHFLLDGLDVQLAFRRCCNGNGRGVIVALRFGSIQHIGFAHWRCEGFGWVTFSRLLEQRLLFRRDEGFVPLFLLLGLRLNLFGLEIKQKKNEINVNLVRRVFTRFLQTTNIFSINVQEKTSFKKIK